MAVIDEHWRLVRGSIRDELLTDGTRVTDSAYPAIMPDMEHHTVCDWGHIRDSQPPNDEDGKLLADIPNMLRRIRQLERELAEARDG